VLRNKIYYHLKPLLPNGFRMWLRRRYSRRLRQRVSGEWPVLPGSERPPEGWTEWPGGKKFAVVLTHDVEGPAGVEKCRRLMQLEQELGFVSSFNFIPAGSYRTPPDLREDLTRHGFEVGVHDLHHDGHLYDSEAVFARKAAEINRHLKEWGAVGFRSGFMLNKLEWLHRLEAAYDASTFDTDPFEPQPQGQGTIFPFWVPAPAGGANPRGGYVELPYTLTQDSTLFLLLEETAPDLWKQKADWIAEHGGMVLVNVHPDYMAFDQPAEPLKTYPAELYRQFLVHLRDNHAGAYWQPLPREVAAYVGGLEPKPSRRRPRRVAMVAHSYYEMDGRVQRYAESLAARGDEVHVLAVRQSPSLPKDEVLNGVHVHRLTDRTSKKRAGQWSFLRMILGFLWVSSRWITREQRQRPFDLLHIHNMPDFLVFAGLLPKLQGTAVLLDVHDLLPEFFNSKFSKASTGRLPRHLRLAERLSAAVADHVIVANDLWLERYARRNGATGRSSAWINYVDGRLFAQRPSTRRDDRLIVMFPGGLYWHQGVDLIIKAFPAVLAEVPNAEFHIYGDGDRREELAALVRDLGLEASITLHTPVPSRDIAGIMAGADLAVVPKRADSFGNEAYSTKIMEFMSLGIPVIASATRIDRFYFNDSIVRFFESGSVPDLARAIIELLRDPAARAAQAERARAFAEKNTWQSREADYFRLVDSLCDVKN
jgi:glycosyltransferase involved in cell wall biosynthesis